MKKSYMILLLFAFVTSVGVSAQDAFEQAVSLLVSQNYDLRVSAEENERQLFELKTENNLPETELSVSKRWGDRGGEKTGIEINQGFDWPGLYRARSKEQSLTREALRLLQLGRLNDKRTQIRLLLIDYIAAKKRVRLASEIASNLEQLSAQYNRAYEMGEVSILDRNKVAVESLRANAALKAAERGREYAVSAILEQGSDNSVMGLLSQIDSYPVQTLCPEEEYEELLDSSDPLMAYYRQMEKVAGQRQKNAVLGNYPSFSLGYGFEREEGQNFHGFNIGIGLPIFSNRNKSKVASFQSMEYSNNLQGEKMRKVAKIRSMVADVRILDGTIAEMRRIFESDSQIKLLKKAFDGGEINLFSYLSDLAFFTEAHNDYLDAEYNRAKILTELNRLK